MESGEISTEVKCADGLFPARMIVWAPTPQPTSSTSLRAG